MLKPIPSENPEDIIKKTAKKARRFMAAGPGVNPIKNSGSLQKKWSEEVKKDRHVVKSACLKMIRFLQRNGQNSKEEVGEMIDGLRRSVLSLERERIRLFNRQKKRKKNPRNGR